MEEIANSFFEELKERYPKLVFTKYKLQAPGFAIACSDPARPDIKHLFMLKMIVDKVLFDINNEKWWPGYNDRIQEGMLRRLLQVEYTNPKMVDMVFDFVKDFLGGYVMLDNETITARTFRIDETPL